MQWQNKMIWDIIISMKVVIRLTDTCTSLTYFMICARNSVSVWQHRVGLGKVGLITRKSLRVIEVFDTKKLHLCYVKKYLYVSCSVSKYAFYNIACNDIMDSSWHFLKYLFLGHDGLRSVRCEGRNVRQIVSRAGMRWRPCTRCYHDHRPGVRNQIQTVFSKTTKCRQYTKQVRKKKKIQV